MIRSLKLVHIYIDSCVISACGFQRNVIKKLQYKQDSNLRSKVINGDHVTTYVYIIRKFFIQLASIYSVGLVHARAITCTVQSLIITRNIIMNLIYDDHISIIYIISYHTHISVQYP